MSDEEVAVAVPAVDPADETAAEGEEEVVVPETEEVSE